MKTSVLKTTAILLIVAGSFASCEGKKDDLRIDKSSYFEKMKFVMFFGRFEFDLHKTNNPDYLKVIVISYFELIDRNKEITIKRTDDNSDAFDVFNKALNNEIELLGDYKHPPSYCEDSGELIIGTIRTSLYFINQKDTIEVTNVELRNELLKFETMVVNELAENNINF